MAGIPVAVVSPNVGSLRELWKGDGVLLLTDVTDEEVTVILADVNPLNTDAVEAGVPNEGVIDGKAIAPKVVVAGSVVVVTSGTVFFTIVWPPNIGVADNEVEGTWVGMDPKLSVFASDVVIFSMVTGLMDGISIDLR